MTTPTRSYTADHQFLVLEAIPYDSIPLEIGYLSSKVLGYRCSGLPL